jgi:hypothetical protein
VAAIKSESLAALDRNPHVRLFTEFVSRTLAAHAPLLAGLSLLISAEI